MSAAAPPLSATVPGGLEEYLSRTTGDGTVIEFEYAPAGYLKKDGTPRKKDWRSYYVTEPGGKRARRTSVTTLLDKITGAGGLPKWSEKAGIKGAHDAHAQGLLTVADDHAQALAVVAANGLGAEAEKGRAADRGLNVHALLQDYMETGAMPVPSEHPEPHQPYIRGLAAYLFEHDPEPIAVEQLVAAPGYAGRMDLVAREGGRVVSLDLKTQEHRRIYPKAHAQLALYNRGHRICGGPEIEDSYVLVVAGDGTYRTMQLALDEDAVLAALEWYRRLNPVDSWCESLNRKAA